MLPALLGIETWLLSLCCSQSCPLNHFAIHGRFEKQPGIEDNLPLQWLSLQSAMVASRLRLFLFLVVSGPFDAESCLLVTYAELAWINFRSVSQTWWSSYPGRNYSHTCVKLRRVSIGELFSFFFRAARNVSYHVISVLPSRNKCERAGYPNVQNSQKVLLWLAISGI